MEKKWKRKWKFLSCTHSYAFKFNCFHNSFLRSACKRNFLETGCNSQSECTRSPTDFLIFVTLWDKKRKIRTININYTLEKKILWKNWNFYSNAFFYLFIYCFFIRFTYFNTVAQTFYILINSQEVSRKSRVSCTSILNLFFFLNVPYSNCVCSLFYTVHFCTFLSPWCPSIEEKRESNVFIWIYYFRLTYFNLSQCYTYRYVYSFFSTYTICTYAHEISKFIIFTFTISNCIIHRGIRSKRLSIHTKTKYGKISQVSFLSIIIIIICI